MARVAGSLATSNFAQLARQAFDQSEPRRILAYHLEVEAGAVVPDEELEAGHVAHQADTDRIEPDYCAARASSHW